MQKKSYRKDYFQNRMGKKVIEITLQNLPFSSCEEIFKGMNQYCAISFETQT